MPSPAWSCGRRRAALGRPCGRLQLFLIMAPIALPILSISAGMYGATAMVSVIWGTRHVLIYMRHCSGVAPAGLALVRMWFPLVWIFSIMCWTCGFQSRVGQILMPRYIQGSVGGTYLAYALPRLMWLDSWALRVVGHVGFVLLLPWRMPAISHFCGLRGKPAHVLKVCTLLHWTCRSCAVCVMAVVSSAYPRLHVLVLPC